MGEGMIRPKGFMFIQLEGNTQDNGVVLGSRIHKKEKTRMTEFMTRGARNSRSWN